MREEARGYQEVYIRAKPAVYMAMIMVTKQLKLFNSAGVRLVISDSTKTFDAYCRGRCGQYAARDALCHHSISRRSVGIKPRSPKSTQYSVPGRLSPTVFAKEIENPNNE